MNMRSTALCFILLSIFSDQSHGLFDPITGSIVAGLGSALYYGYKYHTSKCDREECCQDPWVKQDIGLLRQQLSNHLFGQHIAAQTVLAALAAHTASYSPRKPLTMSFHGFTGSGKTYVAELIALAYFKKKENSKYYHFFNGRNEFPLDHLLDHYQHELKKRIIDALLQCPDSLFIFDEVDMIPPGVLNALVPFLDYGQGNIYYGGRTLHGSEKNRAVFIFLSNTGKEGILNTLTDLWQQGKSRNETTLSDFEELISKGAFNEKGGFHKSDTISTNLIDHYVPFLPLEEEHVTLCVKAAFAELNKQPTPELIKEAKSHVTYGPPPHNIYASSGCKRVEQKVNAIVYRREYKG